MDLPGKKREKAENPAYNLYPFPFSHCSVAAPGTIPILFSHDEYNTSEPLLILQLLGTKEAREDYV